MLYDLTKAEELGYLKLTGTKRPREYKYDDVSWEDFEPPADPPPKFSRFWLTKKELSDQLCVYEDPKIFTISGRTYLCLSTCGYCQNRDQVMCSSPQTRYLMNKIGEECEVKWGCL